jgi:hypothetical protein
MIQMGLTVKPGDPVLDVFVAADGKFGFIELRTVQVETLNHRCFSGPQAVDYPSG